ncbi:MAG TPA: hypothetical protein VK684_12485, partial [Edaphobacter sp.]|nr:hypothetical protein [Edaphobacter sp.]
ISGGHWDLALEIIKPGDFVLIQWGHNDGGINLPGAAPIPDAGLAPGATPPTLPPGVPARGPNVGGSLPGIGEETLDATNPRTGKVETVHTYGWYLRKYITDTRTKKATPILLTVTIRNIWANDADGNLRIERDMGYRDYEYQIGAADTVPVIDMATVEADRLEALGPEKTALLFPIDHTHTSPEGAEGTAESVVIALKNANSPLAAYLKLD